MTEKIVPSSFRDPSGYLFVKDGVLYRRIHRSYKDNYEHLMQSGLYRILTERQLLIPHEEVGKPDYTTDGIYLDIKPKPIPFVSYPYEWSFSQLKQAALLTLEVQKESLLRGMTLKDASAYNVQFYEGKPIFIDTLSFEQHEEGKPWVGYKQFCEHFLAPLALTSYRDIRLNH
ncbi:MAG: SAM-dependent methyltransferase, partial [Candidatus Binatia bacterium]